MANCWRQVIPSAPVLHEAASSLICSLFNAVAGWDGVCSGVLFHGDIFALTAVVALFCAPAILLVWGTLLWPLHFLFPKSSVMWQPIVCVPRGVAAGGLLELIAHPLARSDWQWRSNAPLVGGVTRAVGCRLKLTGAADKTRDA